MKRIKCTLTLLGLFFVQLGFGWNSNGHQLVAEIAYQRLKPQVRRNLNRITQKMFHDRSSEKRFLIAAVWPDLIKRSNITAFNTWHYIDYPYTRGGMKGMRIASENVAWAIQQSYKVLANDRPTTLEKNWFLNLFIHFVGDSHQPLHCITLYSKRFPRGDMGGNKFPIRSRFANNLHSYWDGGLGLFAGRRMSLYSIKKLARRITVKYPPAYFKKQIYNMDPWSYSSCRFCKVLITLL